MKDWVRVKGSLYCVGEGKVKNKSLWADDEVR